MEHAATTTQEASAGGELRPFARQLVQQLMMHGDNVANVRQIASQFAIRLINWSRQLLKKKR